MTFQQLRYPHLRREWLQYIAILARATSESECTDSGHPTPELQASIGFFIDEFPPDFVPQSRVGLDCYTEFEGEVILEMSRRVDAAWEILPVDVHGTEFGSSADVSLTVRVFDCLALLQTREWTSVRDWARRIDRAFELNKPTKTMDMQSHDRNV